MKLEPLPMSDLRLNRFGRGPSNLKNLQPEPGTRPDGGGDCTEELILGNYDEDSDDNDDDDQHQAGRRLPKRF